jgi:hypothetical protein
MRFIVNEVYAGSNPVDHPICACSPEAGDASLKMMTGLVRIQSGVLSIAWTNWQSRIRSYDCRFVGSTPAAIDVLRSNDPTAEVAISKIACSRFES